MADKRPRSTGDDAQLRAPSSSAGSLDSEIRDTLRSLDRVNANWRAIENLAIDRHRI